MTTPPAAPETPSAPLTVKILAGVAVLALLYLGRGVLVPITLAAALGLVLAPLVRQIRRLGLGQTAAALWALVLSGLVVAGLALAIFAQLEAMSEDLPRYETNIRAKVATLREMTLDRLAEAQGRAGRLIGQLDSGPAPQLDSPPPAAGHAEVPAGVVTQLLAAVWGPLGTVGVVLLVLVFVLLEQDSLRDRLIRLVGGHDVRAATSAFNDAGQRLSRYFVSQFSVNLGVGLVVGVLLAAVGMPQPAVWATLAGLLRFVPYVGFPAAALGASVLAAAVVPGWELVYATLGVFLVVEVISAYVVEPQLYGHSTGLSPFSVVVSAIFWGALWGPVGLLLSTPLTLCLVVAGRHVPTLAFLDILFGDAPALTLSQRFYQRLLSGDGVEILAEARAYLKRKPLAVYCDRIVMPAFALARDDLSKGHITPDQQRVAQQVVGQVFSELAHERCHGPRRRGAVLDSASLGLSLRQLRVSAEGRWQGPLSVPPGTVMVCLSMAGPGPQLIAELLARVLRAAGLDARHITIEEFANPPEEAKPEAIGTVFVVAPQPEDAQPEDSASLNSVLQHLPEAHVVLMRPAIDNEPVQDPIDPEREHRTAYSFEEAMALVQGDGRRG